MKKKSITIMTSIIVIFLIIVLLANLTKKETKKDSNFKILTSFYPVYIMTLNITDGAKNIKLNNMAESHTGCIHDYTLRTTDLRKFETTNVFIQNGKDLESFTDNIVSLYPNVKIIESAENVENVLQDEDEINAHIWLSIDNYIKQVEKIAEDLEILNPENKAVYEKNAKKYIEKLNNLKQEYKELNVQNKKAICLNEALEYLIEDLNIEGDTINTDHEQSALSAETIKSTIEKMKDENIKVIFIDKNDNTSTAEVLAEESGAKIYTLDSGMSGDNNKDNYLNVMRNNLQILKNIEF